MNHIEYYEQMINDPLLTWETRNLIKQFYTMETDKALNRMQIISELLAMKVSDMHTIYAYSTLDK
jgi:hypothetical protein